MSKNSNDLYNQIMKKLEEKQNESLKEKEIDNNKEFFEEIQGNISKSEEKEKSLDKKEKKKKKEKDKIDNKDKSKNRSNFKKQREKKKKKEIKDDNELNSEDMNDKKKTRKVFILLIIIQILLLSTLLYILYTKIFNTKTEMEPRINSNTTNGLILMEGYLEIPAVNLSEIVYENTEKLTTNSLVLFDTLNGFNKIGNSVIFEKEFSNKNIFSKLSKLKLDDKIYISLENDDSIEYNIVEIKEVDETDLSVLVSTNKITVTLIGKVKELNKRLIVKAQNIKPEVEIEEPKKENRYRVTTDSLNVRPKPSLNSTPIKTLNTNDTVVVISKKGDWYEIKNGTGKAYVSAQYITKIKENIPVIEPEVESEEKQLEKLQEKYEKLP